MLCRPSQENSKISPQEEASFDASQTQQPNLDTDMFCADAVAQIRITVPKHAILLNNRLVVPRVDLHLVSVSVVFIAVSSVGFCWFVFSFTEVLQEIWRGITRKVSFAALNR